MIWAPRAGARCWAHSRKGACAWKSCNRFLNQPVRLPDGLYWDSLRLFHDIREGLRVAGRERALKLAGVAVDTWGVDYGLLDGNGELIVNPRHYRDARNGPAYEAALTAAGKETIFEHTGLQFMALNSLYQLYAAKLACSPGLGAARSLLFIARPAELLAVRRTEERADHCQHVAVLQSGAKTLVD